MVRVLDAGFRGPGCSPGQVICVVFLGKTFKTLTVPLTTQEYKRVLANCQGNVMKCWGVTCDGLALPSRRSSNIPTRFMLQKPG